MKTNKDNVTSIDRWDKFRAKGTVGWRTVSLFADVEICPDKDEAPFWLNRNKDGDDRPCFRDWFLHLRDMSGNQLALKFLGNQEHWDVMIQKSPWFKEAVQKWRTELAAQLKEEATRKILEIMEDGSHSQALAAAKFLYSSMEDYEDEDSKPVKRGRPSKEEVKGNLREMSAREQQTEDDLARIKEFHRA